MNILVTGGAGYIGAHAVRRLLDVGHHVVALDNLSQGHEQAVDRRAEFIRADLADEEIITTLLRGFDINAIMHFAGIGDAHDGRQNPLRLYNNNFSSALTLLASARRLGVKRFVHSSSALVYGTEHDPPLTLPLTEAATPNPMTAYARGHLMLEWALADIALAYGMGVASLRYFNVVGAHPSGEIGEDHRPETHLVPKILRSALSKSPRVTVYGFEFPTPDGTCVRDYLHVEDLVSAHVLTLESLRPAEARLYNVGTETGSSVLEVIHACERVTGRTILVDPGAPRPNDPAILIASSNKIRDELGWSRQYLGLDVALAHAYQWHKLHPNGYVRPLGPLPKERRHGLHPLFG